MLIPGIFFVIATIIAIVHPLSEKKIKQMHGDMKARGMEIVGECTFEDV